MVSICLLKKGERKYLFAMKHENNVSCGHGVQYTDRFLWGHLWISSPVTINDFRFTIYDAFVVITIYEILDFIYAHPCSTFSVCYAS